jgi:protocatechuate 3,4-dioxygenase, beta subunit
MDDDLAGLSRRELLAMAASMAMFVPLSLREVLAQTALRRTPEDILGPFYPAGTEPVSGIDLTAGKTGTAEGKIVHLMGRVLNEKGEPVAGAKVEIWQANTHGRYTHPSDANPAPLDPNFVGFGAQMTDSEGRFRFKTVKPGPYPTGVDGWTRPPHIHFEVSGRTDRLVTQMYFPGEPLNEKDQLLRRIRPKEAVIAKLLRPRADMEPDSVIAAWDVVLARG